VWFKIYEQGPVFGSALTWPNNGISTYTLSCCLRSTDQDVDDKTVTFTIPAATPSGDYLFRVEHIALHSASAAGGAQFYISCGQITVTGGGSGTLAPLVAFPDTYSATDPVLLIDIYYPVVSTL
jgi:hypothetical protein